MRIMPLVSVIITTYNRPHYVFSAIESVLRQTFRDYELIVVDDGSEEKIEWPADKYENVQYVYQENKGLASARNTGIMRSKGKYLAFLDDDDLFEPNKLERQVRIIDSDPELGFVYSDYYLFWDDNLSRRDLSLAAGREGPPDEFCTKFFVNHNVAVPTLLIRRECFEDVGMFDEGLAQHEDGDMFMRIGLRWKVAFSSFPCALVRMHPSKISSNRPVMYNSIISSWDKILSQNPDFQHRLGYIADAKKKELTLELIYALIASGDKKTAAEMQDQTRKMFSTLSRIMFSLMLIMPAKVTATLKKRIYRLEKIRSGLIPVVIPFSTT